ncbi:hypothetical protein PV327_003480 [Microctonus hyperodae]|uniref:Uncharacterized protein n=1 Tax=Microctonus hyperodae TaxID=165561 RepID=A0AA39G5P7_MICHY|nr:hypothetical protein PV327_003480 [Microctonus hyperodae]
MEESKGMKREQNMRIPTDEELSGSTSKRDHLVDGRSRFRVIALHERSQPWRSCHDNLNIENTRNDPSSRSTSSSSSSSSSSASNSSSSSSDSSCSSCSRDDTKKEKGIRKSSVFSDVMTEFNRGFLD